MLKIHPDVIQGSDEWFALRCGILTASEMKHIITPAKLQYAQNDKERSHLYELVAQRITQYVEPRYVSDDMLRGQEDEIYAREKYNEHYAPVTEVGFITNDKWGFTLGCSPDGLVGNDGIIEIKSRAQKYQIETVLSDDVPSEFMLQVQTLLLVSERSWCDFISYSGGLPMVVRRLNADAVTQTAIINAATVFHQKIDAMITEYSKRISEGKYVPTERKIIDTEIV